MPDRLFESERDVPCRATTIYGSTAAHHDPNMITVLDGDWDNFVGFVITLDKQRYKNATVRHNGTPVGDLPQGQVGV